MIDDHGTAPSTWMAADLMDRLRQLQAERALASLEGLGGNNAYVTDLAEDMAETRDAYIQAAVTEIATLRAELSDPLQG